MEQFIPPATIIALFCAFSILRFENQRWVRAIAGGQRGSSDFVVLFVNITASLALLLGVGALGLVFWNAGWKVGLGLLAISFAADIISSIIIGTVMGGDSFLVQLIATLGLWPLGYFLIQEILISFPI